MKFVNILIMCLWAMFMSVTVSASTNGEQSFRFLFKAENVLWIGEDIGGEYEQSILHQIVLSEDSVTDGHSTLKTFGQWTPIESLKSQLRTEVSVPLQKQSNGSFGHNDLKWTVQPPAEDKASIDAFRKHVEVGGSNAHSFYALNDSPARHAAVITGAAAEPLFFSDRGLFFNYTIDSAYFFPRSGLLLVFTHQSEPAVGLDTMHGFMMMKIPAKQNK